VHELAVVTISARTIKRPLEARLIITTIAIRRMITATLPQVPTLLSKRTRTLITQRLGPLNRMMTTALLEVRAPLSIGTRTHIWHLRVWAHIFLCINRQIKDLLGAIPTHILKYGTGLGHLVRSSIDILGSIQQRLQQGFRHGEDCLFIRHFFNDLCCSV